MNRHSTLGDMKTFHVVSFLCGAAAMLGFSTLRGSDPSRHIYELRLYHVHPGKIDALKARFGDHTDAIFRRHNMKSIGYWVPEDAPNSQNRNPLIIDSGPQLWTTDASETFREMIVCDLRSWHDTGRLLDYSV
jgi:hypothetical protein